MLNETWEHQYLRMHQEYKKLKQAVDEYIDRDPEIHGEANSRHILFDFFLHAYHLKDYIKVRDGTVENLCDTRHSDHSTALAICADIANTVKHSAIDPRRWSRFTPPATIVGQAAGIRLPLTFPAHFTYHFTIEAGGTTYTEIQVADEAIADWDTWLSAHNFPLPSLP